jgi:fermentation-respiration switch protein FrsA (DUF1100 family)
VAIRASITATVKDLRRALDYLEGLPECDGRIGFMGTSYGALLGALLAGEDKRIQAVVLTSVGATWREALIHETIDHSALAEKLLPGVAGNPRTLDAAVKTLGDLDAGSWVGRIAPRPLLLVNGTQDPNVWPGDAANLARLAGPTAQVLNFTGGHDPFAGPQATNVATHIAAFFTKYLLGGVTG